MTPRDLVRSALVAVVLVTSGYARAADEAAVERFSWHPSIAVCGFADDNVYLQEHDPESDLGFLVTPAVSLGYAAPNYEVGADVGADIYRYFTEHPLDDTFFRASGFGEAGLLPGLTLRVSDAYLPQPIQLGKPDDQSANLLQTNRVEGDLRYWREFRKGREMTVGVLGARFDTDEFAALVPGAGNTVTLDPTFRADYWEAGGFFEALNPLGRRSAIYLAGRARYRSFDHSPESDNAEYALLIGFRTLELGSFSLDIAGGAGMLDLRGSGSEPEFLGRLDAAYRFRNGLRLTLVGQHQFTSDLAGNEFIDTTGRLALQKYFGSRNAAQVVVFASYLESESQARTTDSFGGIEVSLRRQLSRDFQLEGAYRFWSNGGGFSPDDFQQNRFMLSLIYRH